MEMGGFYIKKFRRGISPLRTLVSAMTGVLPFVSTNSAKSELGRGLQCGIA